MRPESTVRLLLLEFNELTPALLERFIEAGELPNFAALRARSTRYVTTAGDDPLEPWIQWPTVHCGVPFAEHGARYLGDGRAIRQTGIASALSDAGIASGIFGGINLNYRELRGYYVPDAWQREVDVHPPKLRPYFKTVAALVRENSKHALPPPLELVRFGAFLLVNGLSAATVRDTLAQLAGERFRKTGRWRRAFLLDSIQYDVFRRLNRAYAVEFASFFSNSTAHLQHYYWRNMDPGAFAAPPEASDDASLASAILCGYRRMDALLGRMTVDFPHALPVLCTGLSQQPWHDGAVCKYRPRDFAALLRFAGAGAHAARPVMAQRFRIDCAGAAEAVTVAAALAAVRLGEREVFGLSVEGATVYGGCDVYDREEKLRGMLVRAHGRALPFEALFYRITGLNSGKHHPDGVLWIGDGNDRDGTRIPLTCVAPMILDFFGVPAPATMRGPRLQRPSLGEPAEVPA